MAKSIKRSMSTISTRSPKLTYEQIKSQCLEDRKLWDDPDFPAAAASIHPDYSDPEDWLWKRPKEICKNPEFIVGGAHRFDLSQGDLGDCWFISSAAVIATKPNLFQQIVPPGQDFTKDYIGIFRFRFWQFGEWVEILVDDRLPVDVDGNLKFCQNREEPNEFWGPLLEKAYAKLYGSYEAIDTGHLRDALVDMTGGITELYNLGRPDDLPPNLFEILTRSFEAGSLIGCGIRNDRMATREEELTNGLFKGHVYSVTSLLDTRVEGWALKLVRLRNPWGRREWNGAWSDKSDEWKHVSNEVKKKIGLTYEDEGEFWMSFEDWVKCFHLCDIVHLGPQAFARLEIPLELTKWQETSHHGRWVAGVNAGGSGLFSSTKNYYYSNPHYFMTLREPDPDDVAGECTCIISLLQKGYRKRRTTGAKTIIVGFDVYQMKGGATISLLEEDFFQLSKLKKQFSTRVPVREASCRLQLDPATYCIVVNTIKVNQEAEFLLRIYTYSQITSKEIVEETGPVAPANDKTPISKPVGDLSSERFFRYAGDDLVIDARDLRDLLNEVARRELGETTAFGVETCRCLLAMHDSDHSGTLNFEQTCQLWDDILLYKKTFAKYDKDQGGSIDTTELRKCYRDLGFKLSFESVATVAMRYGGKERTLFFEDFVLCIAKTLQMYALFRALSQDAPDNDKRVHLNLEEWMETTLFY